MSEPLPMSVADLDLTTLLLQGSAALAVALLATVGFGIALQWDRRIRLWFPAGVAFMVAVVPAVAVVLSGRDVTRAIDFSATDVPSAALTGFLRAATGLLVGLSVVRLVAWAVAREPRLPGPRLLLAAFLAFFVGNWLIDALLGAVPAMPTLPAAYTALAMCAIYVTPDADPRRAVQAVRIGLMLVMAGSLAPLLWDPGMVRQVETAEIRIGAVGFRLFGLGNNPNSIATLAVLSLLLGVHQPWRARWLAYADLAFALAVLVLAQSQTSWITTVLALPVMLLGRARIRLSDRRWLVGLWVALAVACLSVPGLALLAQDGLSAGDFFSGERYREVTSLTGRSAIWVAALAEWEAHPLFGYGPTMWDLNYRMRVGMPWAFTAHNQYLQSLAVAGAVGLASLLTYLLALLWHALTLPRVWRGLALALLLQIVVRSVTETPLDLGTPFASEFLPHCLLFLVLTTARGRAVLQAVPAATRV